MGSQEKYIQAFVDTIGISAEQTSGLQYQAIPAWDSVGHMGLIAALEGAFDIMMEMDDIIDLSSFEKGKEILSQKYSVEF